MTEPALIVRTCAMAEQNVWMEKMNRIAQVRSLHRVHKVNSNATMDIAFLPIKFVMGARIASMERMKLTVMNLTVLWVISNVMMASVYRLRNSVMEIILTVREERTKVAVLAYRYVQKTSSR